MNKKKEIRKELKKYLDSKLEKCDLHIFDEVVNFIKKDRQKQLTLTDVSQRSKLYFAFMQEYNTLMGKSEHQILKEEVIVLLAKYSG